MDFDDLVKQMGAQGGGFDGVRAKSGVGSAGDLKARAYTTGNKTAISGHGEDRKLAAHEARHVVQQGPSSGYTKQGSKEIAEGKAPGSASDRQRLRSNIAHPGVKCP